MGHHEEVAGARRRRQHGCDDEHAAEVRVDDAGLVGGEAEVDDAPDRHRHHQRRRRSSDERCDGASDARAVSQRVGQDRQERARVAALAVTPALATRFAPHRSGVLHRAVVRSWLVSRGITRPVVGGFARGGIDRVAHARRIRRLPSRRTLRYFQDSDVPGETILQGARCRAATRLHRLFREYLARRIIRFSHTPTFGTRRGTRR